MTIWSAEIKELEKLYESLRGHFPELEKELEQLIKFDDPNVIMLYSRRCLEVIITDLCECEMKRPRKTEPLQGIIDKLHKEEKVPAHIIASMQSLNTLSSFGAHPKDFDPEQVKPVLINLDIIIKWYLKYKETGIDIKVKPDEEISYEIKSTEDVKKSITISRKKLAGLIGGLFGAIVAVFAVLYFSSIIGGDKQTKELDKSIAVLPFEVWNSEAENQYLGGAIANEINTQLSLIEEFHVISYTSSSRYKGSEKPSMPRIGKELGANFIIEGTIERQADDVSIHVQVIRAEKDDHFWAQEFKGKWSDLYTIRADIAKKVAEELNTSLTDEEKQLIDRIPTRNPTASDYYQRGREEHIKYWNDNNNRNALVKAEDLYQEALKYDSTYAQAYSGLARVYWDKYYLKDYLSEYFMDSVSVLCDKALYFDDQLAEAYTLKGTFFSEIGNPDQAVEAFDKAIKLNPNDWMAYHGKGEFYGETDWINNIRYLQKAASINRALELPSLLSQIGYAYSSAGFPEKARQYQQDKLKLDGDSANYYAELARYESWFGNVNKSVEFGIKGYAIDSTDATILVMLANNFESLGRNEESLKYFKKFIEISKIKESSWEKHEMHRIAYSYWRNGYKKEAEYYFNEQIDYCNGMIKLGRRIAQMLYPYYDLAGIYAFRGEKDRAYDNLRIFNKKPIMSSWMVNLIKRDPLFNSIRNEPEFQQIVRDIEAKYQAEHERVKKWLEEQGMLK